MLYGFILTLLVLDGILLAAVVLLQAGQGGGLASLGGGTTDLVMGGRQAVTLLHTLSWWTGGIFMTLALVLSLLASRNTVGSSAVQERLRVAPTTQIAPSPLGESPATGAAVPPAPAATLPLTPAPAPATR